MKTIEDFMAAVDPLLQRLRGSVRRMAITLTTKALWQLAGFVIDGKTEIIKAEPFTGIGFASRPPANGKPEAIVLMVGDANAPVIIAARDEKTRAAIAGAIKADETMLFTTVSVVYMKDDGTIEARSPSGIAKRLATLDDINALAEWISTTMVVDVPAAPGSSTPGTLAPPPAAAGTTKLKGE